MPSSFLPTDVKYSGYDFNDDVLPLGSALFAGLVKQGLPLAASAP